MKQLLIFCLAFVYTQFCFGQTDSAVLVFEFEEGISYQAQIDFDNPSLDPTVLSLGVGTIGGFDGGKLALGLELEKAVSPKLTVATRFTQSLLFSENNFLNEMELVAQPLIWENTRKKHTRIKLFDAYINETSRKTKPYFGAAKFNVRNDLRVDAGVSAINSNESIVFYPVSPETPSDYIEGSRFNFFSLFVGPRFSRTQHYKLSFQDSTERTYYQKLSIGVNVGYHLWSGAGKFTAFSEDTTGTITETDLDKADGSLNINKIGFGFDLCYRVFSDRSGLFYSFKVLARYNPSYSADTVFPCPDGVPCTTPVFSNYNYGYQLLMLPQISVGKALSW